MTTFLVIAAVIAAVSHLLNIVEKTHKYGPYFAAKSFSPIVAVTRVAYQVVLILIYISLVLCTLQVREPF